ncbi:phage tail protein [Paracoccus litorisediminis]|uniref:Tip attachment protein J domain-containing protein n=1 Tax=Paracoccus litorisediminis TaxID=2006130 RepID=A0A844HUY9_9RHOB|nr:phage tail protein [Paracoccus litorisediminis]MTH62115.1 hypothetical protein [Paracoccus litorisediminis]
MIFVLALFFGFAFADPASAGPVIGAVVAVFKAVSAWKIAGFAIGSFLLRTAAMMAISALMRAKMDKPKQGGIRTESTMAGEGTPGSFVLGKYATAGCMICPPMTSGSSGDTPNAYLTYVIDLGDAPISSLDGIWVGDEKIPFLAPDAGSVFPDHQRGGGRFTGELWFKFFDGTQTTAYAGLIQTPDESRPWSSDMIGRGTPYVVMRFKFEPELYSGLPSCLFEVTGIGLYDPRKDTTVGGSGSHRWGNTATYQPSENPAVQVYNILRGIDLPGGETWGGECDAEDLPLANWFAAMNTADQLVDGEARWRSSYEVLCGPEAMGGDEPAAVIEEILRGCSGRITEFGGVYKIRLGGVGLPVAAFTDDDIIVTEQQSLSPFPGLQECHNAVQAQYPEPAERWANKEAPPRYNATWETQDQGRRLVASLQLPATPYRKQVQRVMRAYHQDDRRSRVHELVLPPDFGVVEPLDAISWSSDLNGYVSKVFEVTARGDNPTTLLQQMVLRETDPSDYDWSPDFELPTNIVSPTTVVPAPRAVLDFDAEGITLSDSAGRPRRSAIRMTWNPGQNDARAIRYEIRVTGQTEIAASGAIASLEAGQKIVSDGILPSTGYQVRARLTMRRATVWTSWISVATPAVGISLPDFVDGVTSLFADAGIKATRDITSRAVPGDFVGELAWSRADSRLYRWNGSTWVHFIQESVQGILDQTAFAVGLRVPKVMSGTLPITGNLLGDTVYRTNDKLIYRWDGSAWTAEVAATQIVGQLIAGQIAAGAIGTDQLAALSVAARHMVIADYTNLIPDNQLIDRASWTFAQGAAIDFRTTTAADGFSSLGYLRFRGADAGSNIARAASLDFPVEADSEFHCQLRGFRTTGTVGQFVARLQFKDGDGAYIGGGTAFFDRSYSGGAHTGAATQSAGIVAPAGAVAARVLLTLAANADGNWQVGTPIVRRKNGGELTIEGTLKGTHLEFETLTGGLMAPTGIITKSAQIDDLVVERGHIKNLAVDTLKIADNAVTIPVSQALSSDLVGNNAWRVANTVTFTMPQAGQAAITWFASQAYTALQDQGVGIRLVVDGTTVWDRLTSGDGSAGLMIDWLSMGWARALSAGSHTIRVDWFGSNSNIRINQRTLIVMGTMK